MFQSMGIQESMRLGGTGLFKEDKTVFINKFFYFGSSIYYFTQLICRILYFKFGYS